MLEKKAKYTLREDGTFVIENYSFGKPFASFLPGIAGLKGIPMWVFYVNRAQGIASFGVKSKDYAIMEFNPAEKAYGLTAYNGFRTFIKVHVGKNTKFYEPFINIESERTYDVTQRMYVRPYEVMYEEINNSLGLRVNVRYLTLPEEPMAALIRIVKFENTGKKKLKLEIIDGLPKLIPYYVNEFLIKSISNTSRAWATVTNFDKTGVPFYKTKVEINDRPEVYVMKSGNFYFGKIEKSGGLKNSDIIIDPDLIFGEETSFRSPNAFLRNEKFTVPKKQLGDNKYASAMSHFNLELNNGQTQTFYSMVGHISSEPELNEFVKKVDSKDYFDSKVRANKSIIEGITHAVHTESALKEFDLYCRQTYLDNVLRGGIPILLNARDKEIVFYVYSRKHGDLERDYNNFQLSPSYYSQGNGNFRDVNQNKRNDVLFNPKINDYNVLSFYNLIQLDGFNPLLIKGSTFLINTNKHDIEKILKSYIKNGTKKLVEFFKKPFEPGDLLLFLEKEGISLNISNDEFLSRILEISNPMDVAEHGEAWHGTGYWVDHWTYNLDLLENYLSVYPDKEREILLDKKEFTYYDNPFYILPREERYVEIEPGKVRQFGSVILDKNKASVLRQRTSHTNIVREHKEHGKIYKTNLLCKMLCLILNKLASLDCEGIGIEMEADKPGWYDALNGLPGILGSSLPETFELKRIVQFLLINLDKFNLKPDYEIHIPEEIHGFYEELGGLLNKPGIDAFVFWDKASLAKENFRKVINLGVSGNEKTITYDNLKDFLKNSLNKLDDGIKKAFDKKTGLYYTYFSFEAEEYSLTGKKSHQGLSLVNVKKFRKRPLQFFLEGEVRYMKTETNKEKIKTLHNAVKKSGLYDKVLKMYKLNASLKDEPADIGRCTVFSPGWLENESIWTHMEYKYVLEILRAGLFKEFFEEFKKVGICFLDPKMYGRSILENSSFIISSAFPEKNAWGRGCVARLSGATAEFLEMWLLITIGPKPFKLDPRGKLTLEFNPAIPKEYFTKKKTFTFNFMGKTLVTYHNSKKIDTYTDKFNVSKIEIAWYNGGNDIVNGRLIPEDLALRIRNQEAEKIEILF
ncbi:MAG: cellobiose phosphorylase [Elusimicrobia bacterium]|nr:cellobiose phosphorylase [Candidatus Liberimonas magnetica]